MLGMAEKTLVIITSLIFGLAILVAVIASGARLGGLQPMTLDLFGMLGKLLGRAGEWLGLSAAGAKDFMCGGDIKRLEARCAIPQDKAEELCNSEENATTYCQSPPDDMRTFCDLSGQDKDTFCDNREQIYAACDDSLTRIYKETNPVTVISKLPVCGGTG